MRKRTFVFIFMATFTLLTHSSHGKASANLYVELPDYCPTPDALALAPDGSLTLTCPNYAGKYPGTLVKISKAREVVKLGEISVPGVKGSARPMGLAYGPDGILYVNANQAGKGYLLRLTIDNDVIENTEIIAHGLKGPNGLRYYRGCLYVTTPQMPKIETGKNTGGVYRFNTTDRDIMVSNELSDVNLIFTKDTQNPEKQFGLDGIEFDAKGRLLVGDFGDGIIYRLTLNAEGAIEREEVYADLNTTGIDGMVFDNAGNLYVTGFSKNKLFKVDRKQQVSTIAAYPDNDGSGGALDQPVDLAIYEGKLIISNFDLMSEPTMVNKTHDKPFTLSYIDLSDFD